MHTLVEDSGTRRRTIWAAAPMAMLLAVSGCGTDPEPGDGPTGEADSGTIPGPTLEGEEPGDGQTDQPDESAQPEAETDDAAEPESESESEAESETEDEAADWPAANTTTMTPETTITDTVISPKSIVSIGEGMAIANNMMYQHTVTIYDTESQELVQELPDTISPEEFGVEGYPETVSGAPVEAVWTDDGEYAYVSQYHLDGMGADAYDDCRNGDAVAPSAVFRYSAEAQEWDQFIEVGRVPKFVELTPDESRLLVTNWCDFDLSVIDTETGEEEMRVPLSSQPRGIAAMPDNETVYVTAMYANELWEVDVESGEAEVIYSAAEFPRHLVLSPDSDVLYVTFAHSDLLVAFDTETNEVIDSTSTGREPRTMAISADGTALYVVNYFENTVSKFDAETLEEIDRQATDPQPIGVTYDQPSGSVWVASYAGSLNIYDDVSEAR
ncbi:MAG: YncE family protein [Nesterenkonia sp.]